MDEFAMIYQLKGRMDHVQNKNITASYIYYTVESPPVQNPKGNKI